MSIAGIAASSFFSGAITQSSQNRFKQTQQEFQQLGQDLQSGNLKQAQTDFAALQNTLPGAQTSGTNSGTNSVTNSAQSPSATFSQSLQKLAQDLQSGNLSAAQADFQTLQSSAQQGSGSGRVGRHHHHGSGSGAADSSQISSSANSVSQLFSDLGQELQTGNIQSAQQSYSSLLQDFQQFGAQAGGALSAAPALVLGNVSLSA